MFNKYIHPKLAVVEHSLSVYGFLAYPYQVGEKARDRRFKQAALGLAARNILRPAIVMLVAQSLKLLVRGS